MKFILLVLVFFLPLSLFTQNAFTGKVLDKTKNPIIGASIYLLSAKDSTVLSGAVTDSKGLFKIDFKAGDYILKITSIGMQTYTKSLSKGNFDLGIIILEESDLITQELVVSADKKLMELKLDKRVYNVDKDASNIGRNASEMLDNIPSVTVDPEGGVSLRGSGNVRILVNGKQSGLVGRDPESLRQLMGDMIESIEVITNPSAKYDAQGEVGIINIILKKKREEGLNGSFEIRTGSPDNHAITANANFRTDNLNLFSSGTAGWRKMPGFADAEQLFTEYDIFSETTTRRDQLRGGLDANILFGSEYFFGEDNILSFTTQLRYGERNNEVDLIYRDFFPDGNIFRSSLRTDDEFEKKNDYEINLSYEKIFEGNSKHKLVFDSRFEQDKDIELSDLFQSFSNSEENIDQKSYNLEFERNQVYQLDYSLPISLTGLFETGAKATLRFIDNDFWVKERIDEQFYFIDEFNNNFLYTENVYAAYVMLSEELNSFSWQLGLRAEQSDILTELVRTNYENKRDYLNFFPTVHLSYKLDEQNSLQTSYSARIERPRFRRLIPFSSFTDPRNFYQGNPDLNPEFTDSYELGHLYNWDDGSILTNFYYRYSTDIILTVTTADNQGNTLLRPANVGVQNSIGFEFNVSNSFTEWWETSLNLNMFYSNIDGNIEVENLNAEFFSWNTRITSQKKFLGLNFQTVFNYRAPQDTPQGELLGIWWLDFGLSKTILDNQFTITLSGQDVFSTRMRRLVVNGETFRFNQDFQWRAGQILLTFSYRIDQKSKNGKGLDSDFD